jgi:hypothetical protein
MKCHKDDRHLFDDGSEVNFTIEDAGDKASSKTSFMEVKLEVNDGNGHRNIVFANVMPWDGYNVLAAIGKPPAEEDFDLYKEDLLGESGRCRLTVEEWKGTPRNKVAAWLPGLPKPKRNEFGEPDQIPF